jgi:hypothetical protein
MAELSITMPRGDLRKVKFCARQGESLTTDLTEVYFTVKNTTRASSVLFQKRLSTGDIVLGEDNYYHFSINPEDTDELDYGAYKFDIEIIKDDEIKQTKVGVLTLTDEVTFASNEGA